MFKRPTRVPPPRQVLVIDQAVQGALLVRLMLYGASGLAYFSIIELLDVALSDQPQSPGEVFWNFFGQAIYWAPGLMVLMPIFAYDLLKVSSRFVGPVLRLRKEIRSLTLGVDSEPVEFRVDDDWLEMADEFNHLRNEVNQLREQLASASKTDDAAKVHKGSLFSSKPKSKSDDDKRMGDILESVGV